MNPRFFIRMSICVRHSPQTRSLAPVAAFVRVNLRSFCVCKRPSWITGTILDRLIWLSKLGYALIHQKSWGTRSLRGRWLWIVMKHNIYGTDGTIRVCVLQLSRCYRPVRVEDSPWSLAQNLFTLGCPVVFLQLLWGRADCPDLFHICVTTTTTWAQCQSVLIFYQEHERASVSWFKF